MWGLRKVGDEMMEERRKLKELVVEQMEMGLLVEVMAVDGNKPVPSVVFHQLFGDFILNFKLLAQGIVEVDPLDVNDLDLKMNGKAAGRKQQVVQKMVLIISEKMEQGQCDDVMETAWATLWNVTDESLLNCERFLAAGGISLFRRCKVSLETKLLQF